VPIQYLLPCSCGRKTPVETQQSGESIVCACGAKLDIPRLLELKKLEKVVVQVAETRKPSVWGIGHSILLSGIILVAVVAVLWILLLTYTHSDPYQTMTPDETRARFQKMSPIETWETWLYFEQNGLSPHKDRKERYMDELFAQRQMLLVFLGIFAASGMALIVGGSLLVRQKRPKKQQAHEVKGGNGS
jgi:hypothetical protein